VQAKGLREKAVRIEGWLAEKGATTGTRGKEIHSRDKDLGFHKRAKGQGDLNVM